MQKKQPSQKFLFFISLFIFINIFHTAQAVPKEIIVIRHADKLMQKNTGPSLSAVGYVRAVKFAFYFLHKFGKADEIVATNPENSVKVAHSIRELQTVSPLVSLLEEKYPNENYEILHPYLTGEYKKLATEVLTDKKFDNKLVLICWDHDTIPPLLHALGIQQKLATWNGHDYDSVYILHFKDNHLSNFELLNNQYPVEQGIDWNSLLNKFNEDKKDNKVD